MAVGRALRLVYAQIWVLEHGWVGTGIALLVPTRLPSSHYPGYTPVLALGALAVPHGAAAGSTIVPWGSNPSDNSL